MHESDRIYVDIYDIYTTNTILILSNIDFIIFEIPFLPAERIKF